MIRYKTLKKAENEARETGGIWADVSDAVGVEAGLEINKDPHDGRLLYFLNSPEGRESVSRERARKLIKNTIGRYLDGEFIDDEPKR